MPDQTMRERVARTLWVMDQADPERARAAWAEMTMPDDWTDQALEYLRRADAALAALATPTPAMVEAGAKALFEESQELDQDNSWDDPLPDEWRATWHEAAESVITAALTAAIKEGKA